MKSTFIFRRSLNKLVINKKLKTMGNLNQKPILYIRNQNENYFKTVLKFISEILIKLNFQKYNIN